MPSIAALEAHRICHNDFWDANVILQGDMVRIIDYQYTHQYTRTPRIWSPAVASRRAADMAEKRRLGWSSAYHPGGDLNQILGIMSEYPHMPPALKSYLTRIVIRRGGDFPYAIQEGNPRTTAKIVLAGLAQFE